MKLQRGRKIPIDSVEERFLRSVGKKIAALAAKRGISIERLAYEAGVSKGYLYDLVKGQGNASLLIIYRISSALEILPSQLLIKE